MWIFEEMGCCGKPAQDIAEIPYVEDDELEDDELEDDISRFST